MTQSLIKNMNQKTVRTLVSVVAELDLTQSLPFSLQHGDENLVMGLYKPNQPDEQDSHEQDEYYFVASGKGSITVDDITSEVAVGDAIFVPANANHKFVDTSRDFTCWVIFFGPKK